jgi:[acyl-carrier-protein] S-malonyltransferase
VISGRAEAVNRASERLSAAGAAVVPLKISIPSHSRYMEPAARALARDLEQVAFRAPKWTVISSHRAQPYRSVEEIKPALVEQLTAPVQWTRTQDALASAEFTVVVEVGPKTVLRDLFKLAHPKHRCFSVGSSRGVVVLGRMLSEGSAASERPVDAEPFLTRCLVAAVATKSACTDSAKYATGVVEPYRKLVALRGAPSKARDEAEEQIRMAANLLRRILRTKRVPEEERAQRFEQLIAETHAGHVLQDFEP